MKSPQFRLQEYSLFSVTFLLVNNSNGAVIYTDINPDSILDITGETAFLDIDTDGSIDFAFLVTNGTYTDSTYSGMNYFTARRNYIWAGPYMYGNKIAGGLVYHSSSGAYWYTPRAFSASDIINSELNFYGFGFQVMAGLISDALPSGGWISYTYHGVWFGAEDHFLGIYFKAADNQFHYGWIRCSVSDSADVLTIKDYAYNSEPETGLYAGTLISGTNDVENSFASSVYSFGRNIYILANNFVNTQVIISSIDGKEIVNKQQEGEHEIINMSSYPKGVYIVTLLQGYKKYCKNVVIE